MLEDKNTAIAYLSFCLYNYQILSTKRIFMTYPHYTKIKFNLKQTPEQHPDFDTVYWACIHGIQAHEAEMKTPTALKFMDELIDDGFLALEQKDDLSLTFTITGILESDIEWVAKGMGHGMEAAGYLIHPELNIEVVEIRRSEYEFQLPRIQAPVLEKKPKASYTP